MINKFTNESIAQYYTESYAITNEDIMKLWELAETEAEKDELKKLGFIRNDYEKVTRLSFAERKVNFESIEKSFNELEEKFMKEIKNINEKSKKEFIAAMKAALRKKDYKALAKLKFGTKGELSKPFASMMKSFFEIGKKTTSDEMRVKVPATNKDVSGIYRSQAIVLENQINEEVANVAKNEALMAEAKNLKDATVLAKAEKALNQKLNKIVNASTTPASTGAFNTGRMTVFELHSDNIYAFQYTAVLDKQTTNLCISLNGRIISKDDPDFALLHPPNHPKCRSFWVAILIDEFIKPKIGKIPQGINRQNTGYTTFQDLQKIKVYKPEPATKNQKKQKDEVVDNVINTIQQRLR